MLGDSCSKNGNNIGDVAEHGKQKEQQRNSISGLAVVVELDLGHPGGQVQNGTEPAVDLAPEADGLLGRGLFVGLKVGTDEVADDSKQGDAEDVAKVLESLLVDGDLTLDHVLLRQRAGQQWLMLSVDLGLVVLVDNALHQQHQVSQGVVDSKNGHSRQNVLEQGPDNVEQVAGQPQHYECKAQALA